MASPCKKSISLAVQIGHRTPAMTVSEVKEIVTSKKINVNACKDRYGRSPLMVACAKGEKEIVEFLLDQGADLNARCTKGGNTPMHYVSLNNSCCCLHGKTCKYSVKHSSSETDTRRDILGLLVNHGATLQRNSDGLDPPCLAALHKLHHIVDFFIEMNTERLLFGDADKRRVLETLGVALALESGDVYRKDKITNSHVHFSKAQTLCEKGGKAHLGESKKSDISAAFSVFSEKECSAEEWKGIRNDDWAIKTQAFLIAERVLPDKIKETYLLQKLLFHARIGVFQRGNIEDRLLQGIQIFKDAVQWELNLKLELGSVLGFIVEGFHMESWEYLQLHDKVKGCLPVMESCLQVFEGSLGYSVHKVQKKLLHELGLLLLRLALSPCHKSTEIFDTLLPFGERLVRVIRRRCEGQRVTSITHHIIQAFGNCVFQGFPIRKSSKTNRVKCLISKLVQCEDATHRTAKGNTMLHSIMVPLMSNPQFLEDVAQILIRNGCDIRKKNDDGQTVEDMMWHLPHGIFSRRPEYKGLMDMISTSSLRRVLSLEEMTARIILRHNIPHEGILPSHLSRIVTGEPEPSDNSSGSPSKLDIDSGSESNSGFEEEYDSEFDEEYDWFDSDEDISDSSDDNVREEDCDSELDTEDESDLSEASSYYSSSELY